MLAKLARAVKTPKSFTDAREALALFNTLMLPRGYMYVDPHGLLHVVLIAVHERHDPNDPQAWITSRARLPHEVSYIADVIWAYDPSTRIWRTVKDRTGEYPTTYVSKEAMI